MKLKFSKMHGLGNDFVVFDNRDDGACLNAEQVRMVADRKMGIGCDQLITLLPADDADTFMRIQNADGEDEQEAVDSLEKLIGERFGEQE